MYTEEILNITVKETRNFKRIINFKKIINFKNNN